MESTAGEYCGFGDLVLTSTSFESRNHTLGMLYGQRLIVDEKASGVVFEGKNSIMAIKDICDNNNIKNELEPAKKTDTFHGRNASYLWHKKGMGYFFISKRFMLCHERRSYSAMDFQCRSG